MSDREPALIYSLFPRLVGTMDRWPAHTARARDMGFNWIHLNPLHYPGFSGSLYAVKDFNRLNPIIVPEGETDPEQALVRTLSTLHGQGLRVMMDLVINHVAVDAVLVEEHPAWICRNEDGSLRHPSAINPEDAREVTEWGDLVEIDHAGSTDREALWRYFEDLCRRCLTLGFDGFRCDAAYKVPAELWQRLTQAARQVNPAAVFAAETLGCRLAEVQTLDGAGFDYLFNSSKYWMFDQPWALQQHDEFGTIAPSISFPESHDTPRLMEETGGLVQVQMQRYLLAALFSEGLLMPIGYEFGFRRRLDVVTTSPADWEETGLDLGGFIGRVNRLKRSQPLLGLEGRFDVVTDLWSPTTVLRKWDPGITGAMVVVVNKDWRTPQTLRLPASCRTLGRQARLLRPFIDDEPRSLPEDPDLRLQPAEIALILA